MIPLFSEFVRPGSHDLLVGLNLERIFRGIHFKIVFHYPMGPMVSYANPRSSHGLWEFLEVQFFNIFLNQSRVQPELEVLIKNIDSSTRIYIRSLESSFHR